MHALDALLETFTWVGFGAGLLLLLVALLVRLADGTWQSTHVMIEDGPHGRVAHWFAVDGGVGAALLAPDQEKALAGRDEADVFTRVGVLDRIRLGKGSPAVRAFTILSVALIGVGAVSVVGSLIQLFARG